MAPSTLIPARMINEVVYCPRLFGLEHLNREWADSADTIRGRTVHRRVDQPSTVPVREDASDAGAEGEEPPKVGRSLMLGDPGLGIVAKIDVLEVTGQRATPIDYKKGRVPDVEDSAYPPERVQVCAQGLLLRAHGYQCDEGYLYFAGSRRRVPVVFTDALIAETQAAVVQARQILEAGTLPPPLVESPKCWGCSLVGICLPDEQNVLVGASATVRPLAPRREEGLPLYVEQQGAKLAKSGGEIVVKADGKVVERASFVHTSRVVVTGSASVTTPLLHALSERDIPLCVHGWSSRLVGAFLPMSGHNVLGRMAQHRVASDADRALELARRIVWGKIRNQRVMLRRNAEGLLEGVLDQLKEQAERALGAGSIEALYGIEGTAARTYFRCFRHMLREAGLEGLGHDFDWEGRSRRPPRDPINALLSLAYAFLVREVTNVLVGIGLDAWVGFLHRPRPGKPALSLDLMEEFRPILADSVVLGALNNGMLGASDFEVHKLGVALRAGGRKAFIRAFERRLQSEATHPSFETRMSYRRIVEVQGRLLGKAVLGEIPHYPPFQVR